MSGVEWLEIMTLSPARGQRVQSSGRCEVRASLSQPFPETRMNKAGCHVPPNAHFLRLRTPDEHGADPIKNTCGLALRRRTAEVEEGLGASPNAVESQLGLRIEHLFN